MVIAAEDATDALGAVQGDVSGFYAHVMSGFYA
jgi:hypothetical protein